MRVTDGIDWMPAHKGYRSKDAQGNAIDGANCRTIHPVGGEMFVADNKGGDDGYYREICYFIDRVLNDLPIETATPESTMTTIKMASAERESALNNGAWTEIKL